MPDVQAKISIKYTYTHWVLSAQSQLPQLLDMLSENLETGIEIYCFVMELTENFVSCYVSKLLCSGLLFIDEGRE